MAFFAVSPSWCQIGARVDLMSFWSRSSMGVRPSLGQDMEFQRREPAPGLSFAFELRFASFERLVCHDRQRGSYSGRLAAEPRTLADWVAPAHGNLAPSFGVDPGLLQRYVYQRAETHLAPRPATVTRKNHCAPIRAPVTKATAIVVSRR